MQLDKDKNINLELNLYSCTSQLWKRWNGDKISYRRCCLPSHFPPKLGFFGWLWAITLSLFPTYNKPAENLTPSLSRHQHVFYANVNFKVCHSTIIKASVTSAWPTSKTLKLQSMQNADNQHILALPRNNCQTVSDTSAVKILSTISDNN